MTDVLYEWPSGAKCGGRVPKERFYERTVSSSSVREKFVSQVQRITWMYKLAPETINLSPTAEVPEIEVLWIHAKSGDVSGAVLAAIDKAIPNPVIFEIHRAEGNLAEIQMVARCKTADACVGASKNHAYFSTGWMPAATPREPMPTAITLPALYIALITPLTPLTARLGEGVFEVAIRLDRVRKVEREIATLERKLRNEPQLNRKIELRKELKKRQAALAALV